MEERNVVSAIIINNKNEVLLQKKSLDYLFSDEGFWCLFGGKIEEKESKEEALKRELYEEINIAFDKFELFQGYDYDCNNFSGKMYAFLLKFEEELSKINLNEGAGFAFFSFDELNHLNLEEYSKKAIEDYFKDSIK